MATMTETDNVVTPIETRYNGYRFRSRLEARWAVFYDAAGISYSYENNPLCIDGENYLPDFMVNYAGKEFLHEVKPESDKGTARWPMVYMSGFFSARTPENCVYISGLTHRDYKSVFYKHMHCHINNAIYRAMGRYLLPHNEEDEVYHAFLAEAEYARKAIRASDIVCVYIDCDGHERAMVELGLAIAYGKQICLVVGKMENANWCDVTAFICCANDFMFSATREEAAERFARFINERTPRPLRLVNTYAVRTGTEASLTFGDPVSLHEDGCGREMIWNSGKYAVTEICRQFEDAAVYARSYRFAG